MKARGRTLLGLGRNRITIVRRHESRANLPGAPPRQASQQSADSEWMKTNTKMGDRDPGANGSEWFSQLKTVAAADRSHRVRIYLWDDAHHETLMRPWTGFSTKEFFEARQAGYRALLAHVAQRMNDEVRHAFARSILLMLSNDRDWIDTLEENLDKWYDELASVHSRLRRLQVAAPRHHRRRRRAPCLQAHQRRDGLR